MLEGIARTLYLLRRYDESIAEYKKALALDPQFGYAHLGLGTVYIQQRKYPEAIAELHLAQERVGNSPSPLSELARMYPAAGKAAEARKILRGYLQQAAAGSFPPKPIAKIYLALGEKDAAIDWIAKAIDARDVYLYLKSDPIWDGLRSDSRFQHLLEVARLTP
jgi:Flp pilus assembly protein TadD